MARVYGRGLDLPPDVVAYKWAEPCLKVQNTSHLLSFYRDELGRMCDNRSIACYIPERILHDHMPYKKATCGECHTGD